MRAPFLGQNARLAGQALANCFGRRVNDVFCDASSSVMPEVNPPDQPADCYRWKAVLNVCKVNRCHQLRVVGDRQHQKRRPPESPPEFIGQCAYLSPLRLACASAPSSKTNHVHSSIFVSLHVEDLCYWRPRVGRVPESHATNGKSPCTEPTGRSRAFAGQHLI